MNTNPEKTAVNEELDSMIFAFFEEENGLICDFCSAPDPKKTYAAHDFEMRELHSRSIGDWAACGECAKLIDAGDHEGLLGRAMASFPGIETASEDMELFMDLSDAMKYIHESFWKNRREVNPE